MAVNHTCCSKPWHKMRLAQERGRPVESRALENSALEQVSTWRPSRRGRTSKKTGHVSEGDHEKPTNCPKNSRKRDVMNGVSSELCEMLLVGGVK